MVGERDLTILPRRQLGAGLVTSAMGLGCMGMSGTYGPADGDEAVRTIVKALDSGVDLIDTSDMYGAGHNEELVGRAVRGRRNGVIVATKFGHVLGEGGRPAGVDGSPAYVRSAFEASARRLGIEHVDLYYQHRVDPATPIEETVGAMAELVHEGKVRFLGLCEASSETLSRANTTHPIAVLQSEYSIWWRGVETEILETCARLGVGFVAYSPLGRGLLTGAVRNFDDLHATDRRREHPRFQGDNLDQNLQLVDALSSVAERMGCTVPQLALAWLLSRQPPVVPIPGAKRVEHLIEDLGAINLQLDSTLLSDLDALAPRGAGAGLRYPEAAMRGVER